MKTKKLFSLSSFLEKSSLREDVLSEEMNTSLSKQPYLLPASHILHHVYGFKKDGHPYIIHVAQLDTDAANELWEVKISKLAFGKDLKIYEKLEADIDSKSLYLYTEILETILPEIAEKIKSKVRCLVFPFPHQLEFSKLETFNFRIKKVIQKVFPSLTKHNTSHPQSQKAKWVYFSSVNLNSVFDAFIDQTTVDIDKVMGYFLDNPEEFTPQKKVIVTNEVEQFPELMNVKRDEEDIPTDEELFSEFCRKVLGNSEELVSKNLDEQDSFDFIFPKFMSFLNIYKGLAVSSSVGKKILEKFKAKVKTNETDEEIFNDFLKSSEYTKEELQSKTNLKNIIIKLQAFLAIDKDIKFTFDKTKAFLLNFIKDNNIKSMKKEDDTSLILDLLKIQSSIFDSVYFNSNINFLLKRDEFTDLVKQREKIFATRQIDFDDYIEAKRNFDLIVKALNYSSNWEESIEILLSKNENIYNSKQNQLHPSTSNFLSWIHTYKDYWKTKDFDSSKSIYFNECLPSYEKIFPFDHKFNFFEQFNKVNKSEEEETFELFLREFCEENSFDLNSLVSLRIEDHDELIDIKRSILEFDYKETDEFDDQTISNFRDWIENKLKNIVILSREKTFGFNLDDLKKPRPKENLDKLSENKQYFELYRNFNSGEMTISSNKIPKKTPEEKAKFIGELLSYFSSTEVFSSIPENQFNEIKEEYKDSLDLLLEDNAKKVNVLAKTLSEYFDPIIKHPKYEIDIFQYTKTSFSYINSFLRGRDSDQQETALNLIESFFQENSTLKDNLVVARGTDTDIWLKEKFAGDYVIDEGIFSSSISLDVAKHFADKSGMRGIIYILFLPKGTRGMYIENNSYFSSEKEFLISPGSVFKILKVENRKFSEESNLKSPYGIVYYLLNVGTITTKVLDKRFKGNPSWNALKERIAMK